MKAGEVYYCSDCGIQLEVVKECNEEAECGSDCHIKCCGKELAKKE